MKKIKNILVPTDFSKNAQNAFKYAGWFAKKNQATIHLIHVVYPAAAPLDYPAMATNTIQQQMDTAKEIMKTFVSPEPTNSQSDKLVVSTEVLVGTPQDQVKRMVEENDFDLVIMGTQGEHSSLEKTFGSVAYSILQRAPCPVIVVPEHFNTQKLQTVAYATNLNETDPYYVWKTSQLLQAFSPIIRLVHIKKEPENERPLSMIDMKSFFSEHSPDLQVFYHEISTEKVEKELKEFEEIWNIDLMVMSKPHRNFFERLFHKSVTRRMAFETIVPLLIIKPE